MEKGEISVEERQRETVPDSEVTDNKKEEESKDDRKEEEDENENGKEIDDIFIERKKDKRNKRLSGRVKLDWEKEKEDVFMPRTFVQNLNYIFQFAVESKRSIKSQIYRTI